MVVSASLICKAYGDKKILDGVSFTVEEGEKVAFVGVNGAGKTTLFKIIAGRENPDNGQVIISKNISLAFLEQNSAYESELTIYEELKSAFSDVIEAEKKLRQMEAKMGNLHGDAYDKHIEEYNELLHYYETGGGYSYESNVRGVIAGLGLDGTDIYDKKISTLSGGQKTRVELGKQLLKKPDILLLDEPTNHLDINSISWLENYLKSYNKTVMIISHDRYFMDAVVSKVVDIENAKATTYNGAYSDFIEKKEMNLEVAEKQFKDQQKYIKKQEDSIKLLRSYNREKTVKRAESKEKLLAKLERIDKPQTVNTDIHLKLTPKIESGYDVLEVNSLKKSYGENMLFKDVSFNIKKEEAIALIGANGIGKTTILKIITNEILSDGGRVKTGVNVKIGYYDQERQKLDEAMTIMEQIKELFPSLKDGEIRNVLAAFLFRGDDVYKPIKALSGGERGRVCLAIIMLEGTNFLILDEPTNHLDMYSKEILESALLEFKGTVLYVSHDRYFINRTATRILELTKSGITSFLGDYDYYLEKKAENEYYEQKEVERSRKSAYENKIDEIKPSKSNWHERKAETAAIRKKASLVQKIEEEILATEQKIKECDELMCFPEVFADAARSKEVFDLKSALESELGILYDKWELESLE